jgi:hypothetical protein
MKVFIVTTGAYSDYQVRAVVSDEEVAKTLSEAFGEREDDIYFNFAMFLWSKLDDENPSL